MSDQSNIPSGDRFPFRVPPSVDSFEAVEPPQALTSPRDVFSAGLPASTELALAVADSATQLEPEPLAESVDDPDQARQSLSIRAARFAGRWGIDLSILATAGTTYAWEQSPENEKLRGKWGVRALVEAHEHLINAADSRGLAVGKAAVASMAVVGGITMAVETGTGLIASAALTRKSGVVGWFNRGIRKVAELTMGNAKKLNGKPKGEIALALGGGSVPVVVSRDTLAGKEGRPFKENAKTTVKTAAGITTFSAGVTGATVVAVETADLHGHAVGALEILDRVQSGKTWWALYGGVLAWTGIKGAALMGAQKVGTRYYSRRSEVAEALQYSPEAIERIIKYRDQVPETAS